MILKTEDCSMPNFCPRPKIALRSVLIIFLVTNAFSSVNSKQAYQKISSFSLNAYSRLTPSLSSVSSSLSSLRSIKTLPNQDEQDPDKGPFHVPRASGNIKIDGYLDEPD